MNISKLNNLSFCKVYVDTQKMGYRAKELARQFEYEIDYADSISRLDSFGVDVVVVADKAHPEDKINYYLRNREVPTEIAKTKKGKIFKSGKRLYLPGIFSGNKGERFQYSTNSDKFLEHADQMVNDIEKAGFLI